MSVAKYVVRGRNLSFDKAKKMFDDFRESGHRPMIHKDPNRRFEVWVRVPGVRGKK